SYASAGQRTLVIDFDFLGRNLSIRMGRFNRRLLGSLLVERGVLSLSKLDEALAEARKTGKRLGETLLATNAVNRIDVAAALAAAGRGSRKPAAEECLAQLRRIEARVVGTIFNRARRQELNWVRKTPLFRHRSAGSQAGPHLNLSHLGPLPAAVAGTPMPWG